MQTKVKPNALSRHSEQALDRARQLAERARKHDTTGALLEAERCRRESFAWLQYVALTTDDTPAPNQWTLERLLAAHDRAGVPAA